MSLSREELQADLRTKLEKLLREQRSVEMDKVASMQGFNAELKRIGNGIDTVLGEIDSCQAPLFDRDGRPAITLATTAGPVELSARVVEPEKHEAEL
jgi:hypothetical protein